MTIPREITAIGIATLSAADQALLETVSFASSSSFSDDDDDSSSLSSSFSLDYQDLQDKEQPMPNLAGMRDCSERTAFPLSRWDSSPSLNVDNKSCAGLSTGNLSQPVTSTSKRFSGNSSTSNLSQPVTSPSKGLSSSRSTGNLSQPVSRTGRLSYGEEGGRRLPNRGHSGKSGLSLMTRNSVLSTSSSRLSALPRSRSNNSTGALLEAAHSIVTSTGASTVASRTVGGDSATQRRASRTTDVRKLRRRRNSHNNVLVTSTHEETNECNEAPTTPCDNGPVPTTLTFPKQEEETRQEDEEPANTFIVRKKRSMSSPPKLPHRRGSIGYSTSSESDHTCSTATNSTAMTTSTRSCAPQRPSRRGSIVY